MSKPSEVLYSNVLFSLFGTKIMYILGKFCNVMQKGYWEPCFSVRWGYQLQNGAEDLVNLLHHFTPFILVGPNTLRQLAKKSTGLLACSI